MRRNCKFDKYGAIQNRLKRDGGYDTERKWLTLGSFLPEPLLFAIWTIAGLPYLSILEKLKLAQRKRKDYSYFVQWKEFPLLKLSIAKLVFFSIVGLASIITLVPLDKTVVGLVALGTCGVVLESTVTLGRPYPTQRYVKKQQVCNGCKVNKHEGCDNLRMLDSFETNFKSKEGFYRPVCCCGFRISNYKELES